MLKHAFGLLLSKCLQVDSKDELLVVYDESFVNFRPYLSDVVSTRGVSAAFMLIPRQYQVALLDRTNTPSQSNSIHLPSPLRAAISASSVVITVLDGGMDTTSVRRAILQQTRPNNSRLAHIPGITREVLAILANSPLDEIAALSERLAWELGEARNVEIQTQDSKGQSYRLTFRLECWEREPMMSPGVILPGSWGNVPPGETFCCPPLESVEGEICINGSVPGSILQDGEEIVLEFSAGKLGGVFGDPASPGLAFIEAQRNRAIQSRDHNWNCFAEFGIGLNPAIERVTGNSLFDEKVAGTIHIALGDNSGFGHSIHSALHADLVVEFPTIILDGRTIIRSGNMCLADNDNRLTPDSPSLETLPDDAMIYIREARIHKHNGMLLRRLASAQRTGLVTMTNAGVAATLTSVSNAILTFGRVHVTHFLQQYPDFDGIPTSNLLRLMYHYRILGVDGYQIK